MKTFFGITFNYGMDLLWAMFMIRADVQPQFCIFIFRYSLPNQFVFRAGTIRTDPINDEIFFPDIPDPKRHF